MTHSLSQNRSLIALGVFALSVAAIAPSAINSAQERMALGDRVGGLENDLARVQHEESLSQSRRELAEQRYKNGCTLLLKDGAFVTLFEGATVVDRLTGQPVVDGMTICDDQGNSGTTEGGKIVNIASTSNHELIQANTARANAARQFAGVGEGQPSD